MSVHVKVRASQNRLKSNTNAAIWSRVLLVLRDGIVSSGGGALMCSCVSGRRGAFSSIAWDGVGGDARFLSRASYRRNGRVVWTLRC
ncbi:hypothetical protein IG631_03159 [Alternaria alternata]|nr:hypothetical protein IG631_03159 [Alternaria alternata]